MPASASQCSDIHSIAFIRQIARYRSVVPRVHVRFQTSESSQEMLLTSLAMACKPLSVAFSGIEILIRDSGTVPTTHLTPLKETYRSDFLQHICEDVHR